MANVGMMFVMEVVEMGEKSWIGGNGVKIVGKGSDCVKSRRGGRDVARSKKMSSGGKSRRWHVGFTYYGSGYSGNEVYYGDGDYGGYDGDCSGAGGDCGGGRGCE